MRSQDILEDAHYRAFKRVEFACVRTWGCKRGLMLEGGVFSKQEWYIVVYGHCFNKTFKIYLQFSFTKPSSTGYHIVKDVPQ